MPDLLDLRYIRISQAELFDNNAKLHNLDQIIESITRYGFKSACKWEGTLNGGRGGIVAGNGRVEALRVMEQRGDDLPIGIAQDTETGEWCVPVLFGVEAGSEVIARAYALDDNNLTLLGGNFAVADLLKLYDQELLLSELEELSKLDQVPVSIGEANLEDLLNQLALGGNSEPEPEYGEDDPTILEGIQVREGVELGAIFQLGRHKIMCGDSTVEVNVRELLGNLKCQMCWTDPPYNVNYDPEARVSHFSKERLANPIGKIANDAMSNDDFFEFLINAYSMINIALSEGSAIYISHADTMRHHFRNAFIAMPWKMQSCLIWKKSVLVFGRADYHWMHEPILYGWKEGASHRYFGDRKQTTILEFTSPHYDKENCDTDGYVHSCQKPTPLISYCIENSTEPKDNIYDPFLGSGSTIIAAQQLEGERTVFGFELSETHIETILQRWEKFTGIPAKRIN
ncbi:DNA methyltransferase [Microcoleus sp. B3-D7]|uniref:DNA methyltransferase n=1 Tax=Microcoleus sp. B3-D7 TaxID=2818659 RepID=UPI002FD16B39